MPSFFRSSDVALILLVTATPISAPAAESSAVTREYIHPWEQKIGYAQVVRHGNTLYLSGITAAGGADVPAQMANVYAQIEQILAAHGLKSDAIVHETIYARDIEAVKAAIAVRKAFYAHGLYPAATWVQVSRLYEPGDLLEIEVEAAVGN